MARQTLPPFFVGTAGPLTCYSMYGEYFMRAKSSLTAERVREDPAFEATRWQASIMAQAARIASKAYAMIPAYCRRFKDYRAITGRANLLLKRGLHDDEILARLIERYVMPIRKNGVREMLREKRRKRKSPLKPGWLRPYRRLRMVEWAILPGRPSAWPQEAIDSLLENILHEKEVDVSPG